MFETTENISKETESLNKEMDDIGRSQILEVKNTINEILKTHCLSPTVQGWEQKKRLLTLI